MMRTVGAGAGWLGDRGLRSCAGRPAARRTTGRRRRATRRRPTRATSIRWRPPTRRATARSSRGRRPRRRRRAAARDGGARDGGAGAAGPGAASGGAAAAARDGARHRRSPERVALERVSRGSPAPSRTGTRDRRTERPPGSSPAARHCRRARRGRAPHLRRGLEPTRSSTRRLRAQQADVVLGARGRVSPSRAPPCARRDAVRDQVRLDGLGALAGDAQVVRVGAALRPSARRSRRARFHAWSASARATASSNTRDCADRRLAGVERDRLGELASIGAHRDRRRRRRGDIGGGDPRQRRQPHDSDEQKRAWHRSYAGRPGVCYDPSVRAAPPPGRPRRRVAARRARRTAPTPWALFRTPTLSRPRSSAATRPAASRAPWRCPSSATAFASPSPSATASSAIRSRSA